MLYRINVGLYKGKKVSRFYTDLSLPDLDTAYWVSKKTRYTDCLELLQYDYFTKKWDIVSVILNY